MTTKIVLALDGSEHATRAAKWCAAYATAVGAEVVVVHAIDTTNVFTAGSPIPFVPPLPTPAQLDELRDVVERSWCKPLADAGLDFRVLIGEQRPAALVLETVRAENADLVVCGRRGRGGVAEFLLGSTSHELSHHAGVPLVIVP